MHHVETLLGYRFKTNYVNDEKFFFVSMQKHEIANGKPSTKCLDERCNIVCKLVFISVCKFIAARFGINALLCAFSYIQSSYRVQECKTTKFARNDILFD